MRNLAALLFSAIRSFLLSALRVPPEPSPPAGHSGSLRVFRAAPGFYRYTLLKWSIAQLGAVLGILVSFTGFSFLDHADGLAEFMKFVPILVIEAFGVGLLIVQAAVGFVFLRLNYELRWYMVSDRALRIREGIFRVREQTMTVANIQNMAIRQGPLQKLFGISDLEVRTAGGGSGGEETKKSMDPHLGSLRGLDNAEEVRDLIWESLRQQRDSGLGDPDGVAPKPALASSEQNLDAEPAAPVAAALEVLHQARLLRQELEMRAAD